MASLAASLLIGCIGGELIDASGGTDAGAGGGSGGLPQTPSGGGATGNDPNAPEQPFAAAAPASYVAKVKALVVRSALTADEVAAVEADPTYLATLVDAWMSDPSYQNLLLELFGRFLQRNAVSQSDLGVADQQASDGGDPQPSVHALATALMGTTGDVQVQTTEILQQHYTAAIATGSSKTTALQSTFVVACLSPQVTAVVF